MRAFYFIKSQKFILAVFSVLFIIASFVIYDYRKLSNGSARKFNRQNEPYDTGPLKIGGEMPFGPGDHTLAPYLEIPASQKFYVNIAESGPWCVNEDCNIEGAFIQTMGGWLQVDNIDQSEVRAAFGLDLSENKYFRSIVIIGDSQGKIIGIYPNKGLFDAMSILKNYPTLANFNILNGVSEFGLFKIGGRAPLKPGYNLSGLFGKLPGLPNDFPANVPDNKNFYIYALQKRKYDIVGIDEKYENEYRCFLGSCRYPEPDPPHDFLFADIEELNGWFLANSEDNIKMIELFGLDPEEVLSGEESLVVVTDSSGIIQALHPGKTLSDTHTILSQIPQDFYRQFKFHADDNLHLLYLKKFLKWEEGANGKW